MDADHHREYRPAPSRVHIHDADTDDTNADGDDRQEATGRRIEMPVSSTAEARDGDAFGEDRLRSWVDQINSGEPLPMFLDHGNSSFSPARYGLREMIGYWESARIDQRDDTTLLVAEGVLPDVHEAADRVLDMIEADMPVASSVGWTDDTGDRDVESDLMEISLVGIPSDPRTVGQEAHGDGVAARSAAAAGDTYTRLLRRPLYDAAASTPVRRQAARTVLATRQESETVHTPEYSDTAEGSGEWDGHDLEDFTEAGLEDPDPTDPEVYNKFVFSETGFPPDEDADYDSLNLEVVDVDGTLRLDALDAAWQVRGQVEPTSQQEEDDIEDVLASLILEEFPNSDLAAQLGDDAGDNALDVEGSDTVTDEATDSGDEPEDTNDETDGMDEQEYRESMLEMQRQQTETLSTLAEAIRQDDEEEDEDNVEEDEETEGDDDETDEKAADTDDTGGEESTPETQSLPEDVDVTDRDVDDLLEEYDAAAVARRLREHAATLDDDDLDDSDTENRAPDPDTDDDASGDTGESTADDSFYA